MNNTFQCLLYFFIESCSYINPDKQWAYFILYEIIGQDYNTVAFSTLYEEFLNEMVEGEYQA
jgi:hypothetical protein